MTTFDNSRQAAPIISESITEQDYERLVTWIGRQRTWIIECDIQIDDVYYPDYWFTVQADSVGAAQTKAVDRLHEVLLSMTGYQPCRESRIDIWSICEAEGAPRDEDITPSLADWQTKTPAELMANPPEVPEIDEEEQEKQLGNIWHRMLGIGKP